MSVPPHPALQSMTKVEQLAFLSYVEKTRKDKEVIDNINDNFLKTLQEVDHRTNSCRAKRKEEQVQLQKFLLSQIEFKKIKEKEKNEMSKTLYNQALFSQPSNQACIFPKIREDSPNDKYSYKITKQKEQFDILGKQITIKKNNANDAVNQVIKEREVADKVKRELDNELAKKKRLEKERQNTYKIELDKMVVNKTNNKEKEQPYTSLPIGEEFIEDRPPQKEEMPEKKEEANRNEEMPRKDEDELKIIDEYFKSAQPTTDDSKKEIDRKREVKHSGKESVRHSIASNADSHNELLQKLDEYEKRVRKGGKQSVSIDRLKKIAMKANSVRIMKPLELDDIPR